MVINYIDDYLGVGVPDAASRSYQFLIDLMNRLGLTISEKKLVEPGTQFVYLGFYIAFNTVQVISRRVVGRAEETST